MYRLKTCLREGWTLSVSSGVRLVKARRCGWLEEINPYNHWNPGSGATMDLPFSWWHFPKENLYSNTEQSSNLRCSSSRIENLLRFCKQPLKFTNGARVMIFHLNSKHGCRVVEFHWSSLLCEDWSRRILKHIAARKLFAPPPWIAQVCPALRAQFKAIWQVELEKSTMLSNRNQICSTLH